MSSFCAGSEVVGLTLIPFLHFLSSPGCLLESTVALAWLIVAFLVMRVFMNRFSCCKTMDVEVQPTIRFPLRI